MSEAWAGIVAAATKVLVTKVPGSLDLNRYALDRALRIVEALDKLAMVISRQHPDPLGRVDLARIAALYTCIGLTTSPTPKPRSPAEAAEDAGEIAADQLQPLLPPADLDLVLTILSQYRHAGRKKPDLLEAQLLSDAVALEDLGLIGLWNQTRPFHAAGKTLQQLLKLWKTQHEYGYWETRLRDGFHFPLARQVAAARLERMQQIYDQLAAQARADDIL